MATPAQPIAKCIVRWLYEQASKTLQMLRVLLEQLILLIDAQILLIRSYLAMADPAKYIEEYVWNNYKRVLDDIKGMIANHMDGPAASSCPEFYHYITDPMVGLLDAMTSVFSIYKDRWLNMVSFVDNFDRLLTYWTATKGFLLAILDVLDDALYTALILEAGNAVP